MTVSLQQPLDLNLLPSRYRPQALPWWLVAIGLLLIGLLAGLVPIVGTYRHQNAATQVVRNEIAILQTTLTDTQIGLAELEALNQEIAGAQQQLTQIEEQASFLSSQQVPRTYGITAAVEALTWVPKLTLYTVTLDGRRLTLTGSAGSQGIVLDYARALQDGSSFTNVQIVRLNDLSATGALPLVEFTIDAEQ